jgi:hypothetical protein
MISIKDVAGFSEPAKELIKSISGAIGAIYEPTRIRRKAKAEGDSKITNAKADVEVDLIRWQAQERVEYQERRRQTNINKIVNVALQQLPEHIDNNRPDDDWLVQFFLNSQDIGNEEMQNLWAKILAGEFARPHSYSLRTLACMKTLTQADAKLFKSIINCIWTGGYLLKAESIFENFFYKKGITFPDFLHLENIGLLNLSEIGWNVEPGKSINLTYFDKVVKFQNELQTRNTVSCYQLTSIGQDLFSLCERSIDTEYLNKLIEIISNRKVIPLVISISSLT